MNIRMICHTLGNILRVEAALMMLPTLVGIIYGDDVTAFYATIGILLVVGSAMSFRAPKNKNIYAKEGLLTVALCWVLMSAFGALPFSLSGAIPSYMDDRRCWSILPERIARWSMDRHPGRLTIRRLDPAPPMQKCWILTSKSQLGTPVFQCFLRYCDAYLDETPYLHKTLVL